MHRIVFLLFLFITIVICRKKKEEYRDIYIEEGPVSGTKYWDGDFYEFYGIPYATVPKGKDRFKAPLPAEKRKELYIADRNNIMCRQAFFSAVETENLMQDGVEDCLVMNILVPEVANEKNLVPVLVYIHSGAFSGGHGNMARFHYLARRDIIVISFNFRLGALGFACLGTEDIPGNAAMKDQVAALRWINKNIKKFGGDPKKVTLAGFSVGAAMAELLALSKSTDGLIDKLILESGSALAPYAINRHPIETATNIAKRMGYNGTTIKELADFYIKATPEALAAKSQNFFLPNSTFGFAPCIEKFHEGEEIFLTDDPLKIMKDGMFKKLPLITGFAEFEGLSRAIKFDEWSKKMNEDLTEFLPADLKFDNDKSKNEFIKKVKEQYFKTGPITEDNYRGYIDYFSDSMFKYSILKSAKLHAAKSTKPVYFYEFSYVGTLSSEHRFYTKLQGASHRDQSSYILNFFSHTSHHNDLIIRDRMTWMWTDFVKYGDPTAYESELIDYKWSKYSEKDSNYLQINLETKLKTDVLKEEYDFWNKVYEDHYWVAQAPNPDLKK